jgi:hypothetical protein
MCVRRLQGREIMGFACRIVAGGPPGMPARRFAATIFGDVTPS